MYTFIFDMDGTLLDTEKIWHESWLEANKLFNLNLDKSIIKTFIGMPKQNFDLTVKPNIHYKGDYSEITNFRRNYFYEYVDRNGIEVKPGVVELLKFLKTRGYKTVVCTSTFSEDALKWLNMTNLIDYFDFIKTGDDVKMGKPNPEIYIKAMKKIGVKPEECFAFEDTEYGIKSASSAGVKTYYIKDINEIDEETRKLIFKELKQINQVIDEIGGK